MFHFLPAPLVGLIAAILMTLNALFWVPILLVVSSLKLVLPFKRCLLYTSPSPRD